MGVVWFLPESLETCEWLLRIDPQFQEGAMSCVGGLPFCARTDLGFMFNIVCMNYGIMTRSVF
jgi:hypothetical protein